jgi:alpha-glucosidase
MYVPRGQWYNYWTNDFVNGEGIWVDTKFDEIPVFIKRVPLFRNILFNNM